MTQDGYRHRATLIISRNQVVRTRLGKKSKTVGAAYVQAGRVPAPCTLGLRDGVANDPQVAFPAVLHAFCRNAFFRYADPMR
jgi:hypothetical protein